MVLKQNEFKPYSPSGTLDSLCIWIRGYIYIYKCDYLCLQANQPIKKSQSVQMNQSRCNPVRMYVNMFCFIFNFFSSYLGRGVISINIYVMKMNKTQKFTKNKTTKVCMQNQKIFNTLLQKVKTDLRNLALTC